MIYVLGLCYRAPSQLPAFYATLQVMLMVGCEDYGGGEVEGGVDDDGGGEDDGGGAAQRSKTFYW